MIIQYLKDNNYTSSFLTIQDEASVKMYDELDQRSHLKDMKKAVLGNPSSLVQFNVRSDIAVAILPLLLVLLVLLLSLSLSHTLTHHTPMYLHAPDNKKKEISNIVVATARSEMDHLILLLLHHHHQREIGMRLRSWWWRALSRIKRALCTLFTSNSTWNFWKNKNIKR